MVETMDYTLILSQTKTLFDTNGFVVQQYFRALHAPTSVHFALLARILAILALTSIFRALRVNTNNTFARFARLPAFISRDT
jgi:hypothetical protein